MSNHLLYLCAAALLAAGLAGCSSKVTFGLNMGRVSETREGIETVITDPDRRAQMQAVVDAYITEAEAIAEEVRILRADIVEKNRDYSTSRGELEALYDEIGEQLNELIAAAAEHGAELRKLCSEDEWEKIFDHDDNLLNFTY
jgi:hypothetical protein